MERNHTDGLEEILFQHDHTTHYPLNINMLDLTDRIAEMVSPYPHALVAHYSSRSRARARTHMLQRSLATLTAHSCIRLD